MGMAFPCGKAMSELAMKGTGKIQIPSSVKGLDCSFPARKQERINIAMTR